MKDITLTVNQIVLDRPDDSSFRVLWISQDREEAYWIPLAGKRHVPRSFPVSAVEEGILSGRYAVVMDTSPVGNSNPSPSAVQLRDRAWNLISGIVSREPAIYRLHERSALLKECSEQTGVAIPNIYKALAKYWRGGMTPNALLPGFEHCGRPSQP